MAVEKDPPPLSEPVIIPIIFSNGVGVDSVDGVLNITFWTLMEEPSERRVVARMVVPVETGRDLTIQIRRVLAAREH